MKGDLRKARKAANLSQQALAELADCSIHAVRLYERGYKPERDAPVYDRIWAVLNGDERKAA